MTTSFPSLPFLKDPDRFNWILGAALLILYGPLILHWYDGWLNKSISLEHEYFSHGVLGLPLALKILWEQRDRWRALDDRWHPGGAVLMGFGAALYLSGISDTVNLSLPLLLLGLCFWLKGAAGIKLQIFPFLLLLFATPTEIPYLIAPYTLGLQTFIAGTAGFILQQFHFDITVQEIYLYVGGRIVEVAPHCAGLKALFTNLYFCMIGVYWTESWKSIYKTLTLFLGAITISVVVNILRNTLLTVFHGTGQDGLFHWFHEGWGSELYWLALIGFLILFFRMMDRLWPIPEATEAIGSGDPDTVNIP